MYKKVLYTQAEADRVAAVYKEHTMKETARILGIKYSRVVAIVYKYGLQVSREERARRAGKGRKALFEKERKRLRWGMPQQTKLKVIQEPRKTHMAMTRLTGIYHYFVDCRYPFTVFYDEQTRRTTKEDYFKKKYGLRFVAAYANQTENEDEREMECV